MKTKNSILLTICLLTATVANAQYNSRGDTLSLFRPGFMWYYTGIRPAKTERLRKYDRLIFDVTYNDWIGDQEPFNNHWASIGFNTNLIFDIPLTKRNTVSLGIGVAHQLTRVRHDQVLTNVDPVVAGGESSTQLNAKTTEAFDKNILVGNAFSLPIELRFRKESWKHLKFHIGGRFGYQANIYSKMIYGSGGDRDVVKNYGFADLNQLIYSAHVRFGLRNWALYASYNFNTLFSNSLSTQLNPIQFGLSISLY